MKKSNESKKEIKLLIFTFILLGIVSIGGKFFEYLNIKEMNTLTSNIFEHPLKVSNTALTIKLNIYKMHRDMKDVVLSESDEELEKLILQIDKHKDNVNENLKSIEKRILGDKGLDLVQDTRKLFLDWTLIRNEVILLVKNNDIKQAIKITKNKGAKHVIKLEKSALKLYLYAQNKATTFKNKSEDVYHHITLFNLFTTLLFLSLFLFIGYYIITRISNYIYKNEHLTNVLSSIREINQIIIREKDVQEMIQKTCNILESKNIYGHAWIVIYNEDNKVENFATTDVRNFVQFQNKIKSGWIPNCIQKLKKGDKPYSLMDDRALNCSECFINGLYNDNSAFTIELKYNNKVFGYLTISIEKMYSLDYNELALLEKVAGDIAYALFNLKIEQQLIEQKELYTNIIDSVENLIFVKDINSVYIACNKAYENFLGLTKEDIIGKNDFALFGKEMADLFRDRDEITLNHGETQSNFEWITNVDNQNIYYLTIKSPFCDKNNQVLGIVGNAIEFTEQKELQEEILKINKKLEEKKKDLEMIIEEAPNPMALHSEDGKIIMMNKAWVESSGYTIKEIPTIDNWVNIMYSDISIRKTVKKHIKSLYSITKKVDEGEFTFFNKSKKSITWQFSSAPLGFIDGNRVVISSAMDITELKNKDEMIIKQSRHAAMGEMIGMIAHQWRQPISVIAMDANNMLLDIALENFNTNKSEKYATSITEQTQLLSKTIDDFRNFFKPDKEIVEVNIREIIDGTLSIVNESLKNNNIEIITSFETDTKVNAYPRELMQVFVNIITNSKDSLKSNKRENSQIKIRVYEDNEYINTAISDNGEGIDVAILPKLFDPYFSTKNDKNGTGLGLYMCKMIIERHLNGTIKVSNTKEGVCFTIKLLK